jgi:5-phospho-D-xylono-1,4-lactonase
VSVGGASAATNVSTDWWVHRCERTQRPGTSRHDQGCNRPSRVDSGWNGARRFKIPFTVTGCVRTVRGDVAPGHLGVTNAHDHLLMASPVIAGSALTDERLALRTARSFRGAGGRAIVHWTPPGMGRRAASLAAIAVQAGIHLIAATGVHQLRHYQGPAGEPRWPATLDDDELRSLFVEELTHGMRADDGAAVGSDPVPAGIIKVAAGYHGIDGHERRALHAAAAAHSLTGAPVCVHLELGTHGPAVLDLLRDAGVPAGRVVLAHLGRNPDAQLHAELAAAGAFVSYDGPRRDTHSTDWRLADLVVSMVRRGHGDRVLLGADSSTATQDSPGAAALMTDTVGRLNRRVGEAAVRAILIDNPARALAWSPPAAP